MTFQVSPGVNVSEIDNTTSIAAISTSIGAFVGNFRWGPVEEVTTVTSEVDLANKFSTPNSTTSVDFHTAAYFLKYSNDLKVVRATTDAARNANAGGVDTETVKNLDDYNGQTFQFNTEGAWLAKYPGTLGNSLKVSLFGFDTDASTTSTNFDSWDFKAFVDGPTGTSASAAANGSSNDEIHIVVIDEDGLFTGTPDTVLEVFPYLSQASDAKKDDGSSLYYKDVINSQSKYIWFADHPDDMSNAGSSVTTGSDFAIATDANSVLEYSLSGGVDSDALDTDEFATGWDLFEDADTTDVQLLIAPSLPSGSEAAIANDIVGIAASRKDAVAFVSPGPEMLTASAIKAFADTVNASTYAVVDSARLKVYDKYNDQYINIPACSSVAGLCAETDRQVGSWYSPAGLRRGQLRGVTKLYYNPSKADRDTLYKAGINPIVTFPGEGTLLFGDKTKSARPSAFDRINVRRLFIVLERSISQASRSALFEFNDEFTRANFVALVEPFLRNIQGRRGITDFRVVCDTSNNTSDVIDRNEFVGDIYIKPARSINFIQLNFIATRTGVNFNEIAGGA